MSESTKTRKYKPDGTLQPAGRGAQSNFEGRYNRDRHETDLSDYGWMDPEEERTLLRTEFFTDHSRTIVNKNDSPDIGFTYSLNAYRGCEHGCAYCYARPTHEYLNLSPGLDFESKIFVKHNAAELLREKLESRSWQGEVIAMSGITDCYQPAERRFRITRACLEVLAEYRNPVGIITKNQLIRRDIDILQELARHQAVKVYLSVTTLDAELGRVLEPRTSSPQGRLKAIEELAKAGIPVGVNIAPVIVGLTDQEMPAILKAAAEAGAVSAGYTPVRLPSTVAPIFQQWLEANRPERKEKILSAIRDIRGGKLNDPNFGSRMRGEGPRSELLATTFEIFTKKYRLNEKRTELSSSAFRKNPDQLKLF